MLAHSVENSCRGELKLAAVFHVSTRTIVQRGSGDRSYPLENKKETERGGGEWPRGSKVRKKGTPLGEACI